jgi:hypothetical protein
MDLAVVSGTQEWQASFDTEDTLALIQHDAR